MKTLLTLFTFCLCLGAMTGCSDQEKVQPPESIPEWKLNGMRLDSLRVIRDSSDAAWSLYLQKFSECEGTDCRGKYLDSMNMANTYSHKIHLEMYP